MYLEMTDVLVPVNIYLLLLFSAFMIHAPPMTPKLEASPKLHPPASRSINTLRTGEIDYDALALEISKNTTCSKTQRERIVGGILGHLRLHGRRDGRERCAVSFEESRSTVADPRSVLLEPNPSDASTVSHSHVVTTSSKTSDYPT